MTPLTSLTPRQTEVLQLIAQGKTVPEIAIILDLSPHTVRHHKENVMERLDLHTIAALAVYAVQHGLIE